MTDAPRPIDPALFDNAVPASEDFFRHANGGWLDANPVPPEYGSWGAFHEVTERNQQLLHRLLLDAAEHAHADGTPNRMVGDYFAAAMDEPAIAAAGAQPLAPYLERVAAATSLADVRAIACDLQPLAISVLMDVGIAPDFEDANAYLVYVGQGGLGLPERDYYTRDDERSVQMREAYVAHVTKQFANLGDEAEAAREAAERILALETRLAEACYTNEQLRDVNLTMNRHTVDSLDELMPAFGLAGFVRELGVTSASVNIDNAGFFTALETTLAETPRRRFATTCAGTSCAPTRVRSRQRSRTSRSTSSGARLAVSSSSGRAGSACSTPRAPTSASRSPSSTWPPPSPSTPSTVASRWSTSCWWRWAMQFVAPNG